MALSDILNAQQYAIKSNQQFDQNAWQNAFNLANNFNKLSDGYTTMADNRRKYQENLDTQYWRTAATNAQNQQIFDVAPYKTQADIANAQFTTQTNPLKIDSTNTLYQQKIDTAPWQTAATNVQNEYLAKMYPEKQAFDIASYQHKTQELANNDQVLAVKQKLMYNDDGTPRPIQEQVKMAMEMELSPAVFNQALQPVAQTPAVLAEQARAAREMDAEYRKNLLELNNKYAAGEINDAQYQQGLGVLQRVYSPNTISSQPQAVVPQQGEVKINPALMPKATEPTATTSAANSVENSVQQLTPQLSPKEQLIASLAQQQKEAELRNSPEYIKARQQAEQQAVAEMMKYYSTPTLPYYLQH